MDPRTEVAIHEAGHACAALLLGKPYGAALHENGGGVAGTGDLSRPAVASDYTPEKLDPCYKGEELPHLLNDAAITAAGAVAVSVASCEVLTHVTTADRNLIAAACRVAFPGGGYPVEVAFCALAIARARSLLALEFVRVEAVARALSERGRLTAAEVAEIYHATPGGTD